MPFIFPNSKEEILRVLGLNATKLNKALWNLSTCADKFDPVLCVT